MEQQNSFQITKKIITSKALLIITAAVIVLTILSVWLFDLGKHRTLYENTILSTSILSLSFFLFLVIGLYKGVKIRDDVGKITDKIKFDSNKDVSSCIDLAPGFTDFVLTEGIAGIIIGIFAWLLFSILILVFIWIFGTIVWTMILVFVAMLYWIFFRALRLVFKNSIRCEGDLSKSITYGLAYTVLYIFWIFAIILTSHYLIN